MWRASGAEKNPLTQHQQSPIAREISPETQNRMLNARPVRIQKAPKPLSANESPEGVPPTHRLGMGPDFAN